MKNLTPIYYLLALLQLSIVINAQIPTNGLIAWYPFNGNANDASGNGHNGAIAGATLTTDRFGNSNSAFLFDGNDYIQVNNDPDLTPTTSISVSCWTNRSQLNNYGVIVSKDIAGTENGYRFDIYVTKGRFIKKGSSFNLTNQEYSLNQWYHTVCVFDGNSLKYYINGVLDATYPSTEAIIPVSQPLIFGVSTNFSPDHFFFGKIDDIRIYSTALTETEVLELFNEGCNISLNLPDTLMACHQESLVLDAGAGFTTYAWNTGATAQTINVTETGTYSVTVTDNFGCSATDSTYVNIINVRIAQNDTTICINESIALGLTSELITNIPGHSYKGLFNGHAYYLSNNPLTWIEARDLCFALGGHLVTISDAAENNFVWSINSGYGLLMGFTDEEVEGTFKWITNEPVSYTNWYPGEPNNSNGIEDYSIMYVNGYWNDIPNGFSNYILEIDSPSVYSYLWSTGEMTPTITVAPTQTTTYYVEISDGINACTDSVIVNVNNVILNLPDTIMACHQESLVLDAGAGFAAYTWSTGASTQTINVNESGTYSVTVTDNFGCSATDSIYANIINVQIVQNDTTINAGESIELSVNAGVFNNITNGLVAWYPFDGNANDASGNGNNGVVNGATLTYDRFGNTNSAYLFDGVNDYITVPSSASLNSISQGPITMCCWVNTTEFYTYGTIILQFNTVDFGGGGYQYNIWAWPGEKYNFSNWNHNNGGDWGLITPQTYSPGLWKFLCVTVDPATNITKIFVDGQLVITGTNTIHTLPPPVLLFFGRHHNGGGHFHGIIDDIRYYSRIISESEISTLYNEGTGNYSYLWSTGETNPSITVSPTQTTTYYVEISDGINTCTDSVTITVANTLSLDIKAGLEGPWFSGQMTPFLNVFGYLPLSQPYSTAPWNYYGTETVSSIPNGNVIDWVLVELRETAGSASTATSNTTIGKKAAFMLKDGSVVASDGISNVMFSLDVQDNLYAVLWQRNHLGILSNFPLVENNGVYSYDFRISANQAYGGTLAQKQVSQGNWAMIAGDGNADGQVSNADKNDVWKLQTGLSGYWPGDFNMNGQVDNTDKNLFWKPNTGKGTQVPE